MALIINDATADELARVVAMALTDGYLEIHGTNTEGQPALLAKLRLPMTAFVADAGAGGQVLSGRWFGTVRASGTAETFVIRALRTDLSVAGAVTATGGGGDVEIGGTSLTLGNIVEVTTFRITFRGAA